MSKTYLFFIILFFLSSCKIFKNAQHLSTNQKYFNTSLKEHQPKWISLKGKISIKNQVQNIDLNIQIKAKKDSIIFFSIKAPLGIELLRGKILTDSVFIIDRAKKIYLHKKLNHIYSYTNQDLNFQQLYAILSGSAYFDNTSKKCTKNETKYICTVGDFIYEIDCSTFKILTLTSKRNNENFLECKFLTYSKQEKYCFPSSMNIKIGTPKSLEFFLEYNNIVLDRKQQIRFNKPKNYATVK